MFEIKFLKKVERVFTKYPIYQNIPEYPPALLGG
jgi:hypothetical protein